MRRRIAILVGINNYERCGLLSFAAQDVGALKEILLDPRRGGYQEEYVKLLTDNDGFKPHRANILRTVRNMTRAADAQDDLLFCFSGHGLTAEGKAYLVPTEGSSEDASDSCVSIAEIRSLIEQSKANSKLMILDACYSGLEMGKPATGRMTAEFEESLKSTSEAGIAVLSSCKANERSLEDPELAHGVFSHYLIEGLAGPADSDKDNDISVFEAFEYVSKGVKEWTVKHNEVQTPTLYAKLAGEVTLVSVPTSESQKHGLPLVKRLTLHKVLQGTYFRSGGGYSAAKETTEEECASDLGRLGATLAELFGPDNITSADELNKSYSYGNFGGRVLERENRFDYVLDVEVESEALYNEKFLVTLLREGFDILRYELSAPINVVTFYRISNKYDLKVTSYTPPSKVSAETQNPPDYEFSVENSPTAAKIRIVRRGAVDDSMVKAIGPARVQEIAKACQ